MKKRARRHENFLGEVSACRCGGVNLTMGAITLHVAADEAEALGELARAAVDIVRGRSLAVAPEMRNRPARAPRLLH